MVVSPRVERRGRVGRPVQATTARLPGEHVDVATGLGRVVGATTHCIFVGVGAGRSVLGPLEVEQLLLLLLAVLVEHHLLLLAGEDPAALAAGDVVLPESGRLGVGTHVVHEVMAPPELPTALLTREGLLPLVDEDVGLQLVRVRESRGTDVALVGLLARVNAEMPPEVRHLNELSVAVTAAVGLFPRVEAHVRLQVVVSRESLVAHFAFERLFTGMCSFMILEHVFVAEGAVADLAREHLVPPVVLATAPAVAVPRERSLPGGGCSGHGRGRSHRGGGRGGGGERMVAATAGIWRSFTRILLLLL